MLDPDNVVPVTRQAFGFITLDELMKEVSVKSWIVADWLPSEGLSLLFGDSGAGKTFMALDWALHIAAGMPWHGQQVEQGSVFYVVGEGRSGLKDRISAWCRWHDVEPRDLPFYVSTVSAQLYDELGALEVADAIKRTANGSGRPALIVVDTLARNFGAGNESNTADMNQFVNHLDVFFCKPFSALLLIVHHPGHGEKDRARGAYSLHCAMDAEYQVTRDDDLIRLVCTKMKDAEQPDPMAFNSRKVELDDLDEYGTPRTSLIFERIEYKGPASIKGLGKRQKQAVDVLKAELSDRQANIDAVDGDTRTARVSLDEWRQLLEQAADENGKPMLGQPQYHRQRWSKMKAGLIAAKAVSTDGVFVTPDF